MVECPHRYRVQEVKGWVFCEFPKEFKEITYVGLVFLACSKDITVKIMCSFRCKTDVFCLFFKNVISLNKLDTTGLMILENIYLAV